MVDPIEALRVLFSEFYFWVMIALMFLIHVGFCTYEMSVSRYQNAAHTLMKNIMLIPLVTMTMFFFGWWFYFAFQNGPGITGGLLSAPWALPWSELMGPHLGGSVQQPGLTVTNAHDWARLNGVFFAAFTLFSWTTASIVSGALIERVRSGAYWIIAILVGSVTWIIAAAWGWSSGGWMTMLWGYHDAYASGVVHAVGGGTALGVLCHLGPRIGRFRPDGTARTFPPQSPGLATLGLFFMFTGFWGFYGACNVPIFDLDPSTGTYFTALTIYMTPTTLGAITMNFLMSFSGGLLMGYRLSHGDAFWTASCGLAGIIAASAGNDLYHPLEAFLVGAMGAGVAYYLHNFVERKFHIDDAVGAVAVHGYAGAFGVIAAGVFLYGYPALPIENSVQITLWGQVCGALLMFFGFGFIPGYLLAWIFKKCHFLRIPHEVELLGLDIQSLEEVEVAHKEVATAELSAFNQDKKQ